jgi:hypothetical protein
MKLSIDYRGPSDYDVEIPDDMLDAMEMADLLVYVGSDMRDQLLTAGWMDMVERERLQ